MGANVRRVIARIVVPAVMFLAAAWSQAPVVAADNDSHAVRWQTIDQQVMSGFLERHEYIISDPVSWQALWGAAYTAVLIPPPLPLIDFGHDMVIGIAAGEYRTGGHVITITSIDRNGDTLEVAVTESMPSGDCVVLQALTQPYHLVQVEQVAITLVAFTIRRSYEC